VSFGIELRAAGGAGGGGGATGDCGTTGVDACGVGASCEKLEARATTPGVKVGVGFRRWTGGVNGVAYGTDGSDDRGSLGASG
jgi:hypothetical protein